MRDDLAVRRVFPTIPTHLRRKNKEFTIIETGWWSLLPPLVAIVLALITKEVYSSLFIGVFSGMLIYTFAGGGSIVSAVSTTFDMMYSKIADNAYMIIFLALLWAVVVLVSKSGGSQAYGRWAGKRLKSKRSWRSRCRFSTNSISGCPGA